MSFDANSFLASLLVGSIGFVLFSYGKTQKRFPHMLVGILSMGYPYFVSNVFLMMGIAVALFGALWVATRLGW